VATIWNDDARLALMSRFEKLTAETKPKWGQFTAGKMVKHCADGVRMAIGELAVAPKPGPFRLPIVKHLIIFVLPWPQGVPTAPELIPQTEPSMGPAVADLKGALLRLRNAETLVPHPAFGKLSRYTWGALIHRHLDHHLKQFGV
jgi:hypothetical protein